MSRTDKTDPYWVKIFSSHREHHDHRKGYCDLPALELKYDVLGWRGAGRCYWEGQWNDPIFRCPCNLCSQRDWHRRELRTERYEGKRQARDWWREY